MAQREAEVLAGDVAYRGASKYLLVWPPDRTPDTPTPLVVMLHGLGDTALSFAQGLAPLVMPECAVLAIQAPHPFYVDLVEHQVGYCWHTEDAIASDLATGVQIVRDAIATVQATRAGCHSRPVLFGHSQGGQLAFELLTRHREEFSGALMHCADALPTHTGPLDARGEGFPVMLAYGTRDTIIAPDSVERTGDLLADAGYAVTHLARAKGHEFTQADVVPVREFLLRCAGVGA